MLTRFDKVSFSQHPSQRRGVPLVVDDQHPFGSLGSCGFHELRRTIPGYLHAQTARPSKAGATFGSVFQSEPTLRQEPELHGKRWAALGRAQPQRPQQSPPMLS